MTIGVIAFLAILLLLLLMCGYPYREIPRELGKRPPLDHPPADGADGNNPATGRH